MNVLKTTVNGNEYSLDLTKLDKEQRSAMEAYLIEYGFGVVLQRAPAGIEDDAKKVEAIQKRLDNLQSGIIAAGGGGARLSDMERELRIIAKAHLVKKIKSADADKLLSKHGAEGALVEQFGAEKVAKVMDQLTKAAQSAIKLRNDAKIDLA